MDEQLKQKIKDSLKIAIRNFFRKKENKKIKTSNILDILFPKERRIRSLIGGLETSMGIVWEAIAKTLAQSNGFEICSKAMLTPSPLPDSIKKELDNLIYLRETEKFISTDECINRLREAVKISELNNLSFVKPRHGHGVDLCLRKHGREYLFDLKSPSPNTGDFQRFNQQLLKWYTYKLIQNPNLLLEARIAFVFNPFEKDWYEQQKSKISNCLDQDKDIWVENEFWDFCSGQTNTWQSLEDLFRELKQEGFSEEFEDIFNSN